MTNLIKQQALDADPKAIQQIDITGNLEQPEGATMFFIFEEAKETIFDFSQGTVRIIKFSNLQLNKLNSGIKNGTEVSLNLSSNVIGNFNGEYNFPHKL